MWITPGLRATRKHSAPALITEVVCHATAPLILWFVGKHAGCERNESLLHFPRAGIVSRVLLYPSLARVIPRNVCVEALRNLVSCYLRDYSDGPERHPIPTALHRIGRGSSPPVGPASREETP